MELSLQLSIDIEAANKLRIGFLQTFVERVSPRQSRFARIRDPSRMVQKVTLCRSQFDSVSEYSGFKHSGHDIYTNKTAREEKRKQNKYRTINTKLGKFQGLFYHKSKGVKGPAWNRIPPPSHPGESRRWISPRLRDRKLQWEKKFAGYGSFVLSTQVLYHLALLSLSRDSSWFLIPIINVADWNANAHSDFNQGKTAKAATSSNGIIFYPLIIHSSSTDPPQCHPDLPKSCPILVIQWDDLFKDVAVNTQEIVVSWNLQRICQRDLL